MNEKELTKTFIIISNWKNHLVFTKKFSSGCTGAGCTAGCTCTGCTAGCTGLEIEMSSLMNLYFFKLFNGLGTMYPQEVLLVQFSLYVHKGGLKPPFISFFSTYGFSLIQCFRSEGHHVMGKTRDVLEKKKLTRGSHGQWRDLLTIHV